MQSHVTRRQFLATATAAAAQTAKPPNVVLIMADDAGYECFSPYGTRQYATPVLSRLADSGVRFDHCYSTPLCTPTRVALMTGRNSVRNYTDFGALAPGEPTFAGMFRRSGYATAIAGKWQLQGSRNVKGTGPSEAGFDEWCLWNTSLTNRSRYWNPSIEVNGKLVTPGPNDYGPDHYSRFLLHFIERNRGTKPFFAYYPMVLTHSPFDPTPDSRDRRSNNGQRNFEDMVAYTDKIVGRFVDALHRWNLANNTILIFTADNGTQHDIRSTLNGRAIQGDKGAATDAGTHVPLIVYAPGRIKGGRVSNDLIDTTDFLPTLAEAIGAQPPAAIDGQSFWKRLRGEKAPARDAIFSYYFPRPYAEAYDTPYQHPEIRFARDQRYKLYGDGRLYDLDTDPAEQKPLAPAAPARTRLQAVLDSMPAHGERIPSEHWQRARGIPVPRWH